MLDDFRMGIFSFTVKQNNSVSYVILTTKIYPYQSETVLALINEILLSWRNLKPQVRKIVTVLFPSQIR